MEMLKVWLIIVDDKNDSKSEFAFPNMSIGSQCIGSNTNEADERGHFHLYVGTN